MYHYKLISLTFEFFSMSLKNVAQNFAPTFAIYMEI